MPEQVWKCNYCARVEPDEKTASDHESGCKSNPNLSGCFSCVNYEDGYSEIFGWNPSCKLTVVPPYEIPMIHCTSWESRGEQG